MRRLIIFLMMSATLMCFFVVEGKTKESTLHIENNATLVPFS